MERVKLTSKVALIRKRHKLSLEKEISEKYDIVEMDDKFILLKLKTKPCYILTKLKN